MKITYIPEVINGEQAQGDTINKYGVDFVKGQSVEIEDQALAEKMLTCPYFVEGDGDFIPAPPKPKAKKRGRPARVINVED